MSQTHEATFKKWVYFEKPEPPQKKNERQVTLTSRSMRMTREVQNTMMIIRVSNSRDFSSTVDVVSIKSMGATPTCPTELLIDRCCNTIIDGDC